MRLFYHIWSVRDLDLWSLTYTFTFTFTFTFGAGAVKLPSAGVFDLILSKIADHQ